MMAQFKSNTLINVLNFILFQTVWFLTIWSASVSRPFLGVTLIVFIAIGYIFISKCFINQFLFFLGVACIGLWVDSSLINLHILYIESIKIGSLQLSPPFMVLLWVNLATTFDYSLNWIQKRYVLGSVFGGIGGSSSYYAGVKLNAAQLGQPEWISLLYIGVTWAIVFPLLQVIWTKFNAVKGPKRVQTRAC